MNIIFETRLGVESGFKFDNYNEKMRRKYKT